MGAANVIPGVSGGTIAFITGIYERLINALKSFDVVLIKDVLSGKFKHAWIKVDGKFLLMVFGGVLLSILSLAKLMEIAFEQYEQLTLSFFFGLIIASIWAVSKQLGTFDISVVLIFLLGATLAASIAFLPPAEANESFLYVILCGIVAVCSMILPGLSGSYILLLMGNYVLVLQAISSFNFKILIPMLIGIVIGLVLFSRVLSYLFKNFKNATIALLAGFVAGSLIIIWPWKRTIYVTFEGKEKAIGYEWFIPEINWGVLISIFLILAGVFLVWFIERRAVNPED